MTYTITYFAVIWLALAYSATVCAQGGSSQEASTAARQLLSEERAERERALEKLRHQHVAARRELTIVLEEAGRNHRDDQRYMSPLHGAIQAVEAWRIFETEDMLFSIITYQLDTASLPVGQDIAGDYFYPAARALVRLRVDTRKVTDAIAGATNERQIQLLTWVLHERMQSADEARRILERRASNPNIANAIKMLDLAPDLLPPPAPVEGG
jgi:hypothetical protein